MRGRTASTNACVVAVRLPWWATLSRSRRGSPACSRRGSISSSTSPASRKRYRPTVPSSTIDTLLIPVPPSGGSMGTSPGSGHRTVIAISSTARRSPAARPERSGESGRASRCSHAAYPGPGPRVPGSNTRRTRYRSSSRARPATWSSCGWDSTTASRRRSHGGSRRSSATSRRVASGPPSTRTRPPCEPSIRMASPWPTSSTVIRATPEGRAATTAPVTRTATASPSKAVRVQRPGAQRPVVGST
jgi:hypothetical protein